jgi:transcription elongation factor GreA
VTRGVNSSLTAAHFSIRSQLSSFLNSAVENSAVQEFFMKKIPITKEGYEKLKKELEYIKTVSLPENIKDIEVARAHGDITENAEYQAAKERQSFLQGRIQELENNLATSYIVSLDGLTNEKVVFGATVTVEDMNTGSGTTYQLVGPFESDINENKISVTSPIGKALIGKSIGDEISVKTPGGTREFEVVNISVAGAK